MRSDFCVSETGEELCYWILWFEKVIMIRVHGFRVIFLRYLVRALSVTPNGKGVFLEAAIQQINSSGDRFQGACVEG